MESEETRRMLEAVKELKSEFYVGTQEAWKAIKAHALAYENPRRIAEEINMRAGLEKAVYKATPERLVGIGQMLMAVGEFMQEFQYPVAEACQDLSTLISGQSSFLYKEWLFKDEEYEQEYEHTPSKNFLFELTKELFNEANKEKVKTDEEFGRFLTEKIANGLKNKEIKTGIHNETGEECSEEEINALKANIYVSISNLNFENLFSVIPQGLPWG